jgi:hypothetical protein
LPGGREGIHHVRYRVDDVRATIAALGTIGFTPIWRHDMGYAFFAYLEHTRRKKRREPARGSALVGR